MISPEPWAGVHISKHVLAETLVRMGHRVCFWDPPVHGMRGLAIAHDQGMDIVHYGHWFRGVNRLPRFLREWYHNAWVRRIERAQGRPFDVIWCFDTTRIQEFPSWPVERILHLVDYDTLDTGDGLIRTADLVITVAEPISEHARRIAPNADVHTVGHMVDERWLEGPDDRSHGATPTTAAYAGNLATLYIDWPMIRAMMERHPEVHFHMYGPHRDDLPDADFQAVRRLANCTFHGLLRKEDLIPRLRAADILIFCYKAHELQAIASNAHKLLEYLSTGNVVVGSYVSSYAGTDLFLMAHARKEVLGLFDRACGEYVALNTEAQRGARIAFARAHTMPGLVRWVEERMRGK